MIARLFDVTMKPELLDAAVAAWPAATARFKGKGLVAGYMLILDRPSAKVLSVTLWESEEAVDRNLNSPELKSVMAQFRTYFATEPSIRQCAVAAAVT